MNNGKIHMMLAAALLSMLCMLSCVKESSRGALAGVNISFGQISTKGMLDNSDFQTNGTKLHVYDFISGFSGTLNGTSYDGSTDIKYIDDVVVKNSSEVWAYENGNAYQWTKHGDHKFFGYLSYDAQGSLSSDGPGGAYNPALSGEVLTVPAKALSSGSSQMDFMYSNIIPRPASAENYSLVGLTFSHLFSAIKFTINNNSGQGMHIKSFTVDGFRNSNSATIDYSANPSSAAEPVVTYGSGSVSGTFLNDDTDYDLADDAYRNVCDFLLVWPLATEALVNEGHITMVYTVDGNYVEGSTTELEELTSELNLTGFSWEPGHRYSYTLLVNPKSIELRCSVLPWSYQQTSISFQEASATVTTQLSFVSETYGSMAGNRVYASTTSPYISAHFAITNPVGARITVVPSNNEYFSITMDRDIVDPTWENGRISFKINLNPNNYPKSGQYETKLSFYLRLDGDRDLEFSSEVNRDDYIIVY